MERADIVIIGAGVVGLAIASEVSRASRDVLILEKNPQWGMETSSRNSEVVHGGLYYRPGSLKAEASRSGRERIYALAEENGIPFKKTGKLIVAVNEGETGYLESLMKNAADNNVVAIMLDEKEARRMEPAVKCRAALFSPETGIIDTHELMKYFLRKARSLGAELVTLAEVTGIERSAGGYVVKVDNSGEEVEISARVVINSAGNNAGKIASMAGIDIGKCGYEQIYSKGEYFRVSDKFLNRTKRLVYPVPLEKSLGIHTVLDIRGGVRLGPDETVVPKIDHTVDANKRKAFYDSVKRFIPSIEEEWLSPDIAGIRPQLKYPNDGSFRDFIISHEAPKGMEGFIDLIGIESPGLTASPVIALRVAGIVDGLF
ncbi:MAG: NAD(P)/FAD-dependent oxidoreductase [Candidatus Omnitrophica bacterium]|nr:NAD(P)/FAD-dependent oxidoreductase [Candidatus Omnitrophota bacterium]